MSETHITRRSLNDRRTGQTDWKRLSRQSDAEIKEAAASDPDAAPLLTAERLAQAEVMTPRTKKAISIRLDPEVLEFFQESGKNYQTRINTVLRAYVAAHKKSA